jgi:hypothetical protein
MKQHLTFFFANDNPALHNQPPIASGPCSKPSERLPGALPYVIWSPRACMAFCHVCAFCFLSGKKRRSFPYEQEQPSAILLLPGAHGVGDKSTYPVKNFTHGSSVSEKRPVPTGLPKLSTPEMVVKISKIFVYSPSAQKVTGKVRQCTKQCMLIQACTGLP